MQKVLSFNINESVTTKDETIKGFVLDVVALQSDGATKAAISDLNKIQIDVIVRRGMSKKETVLFAGYLDDYLTALYSQTTRYELNKKQFENGYKFYIDFNGVLKLEKGDEFEVRVKAQNTAFTSLSIPNSNIIFETIPAIGYTTLLPMVKARPVGNSEEIIDMSIGDGVVKITAAMDYTSPYGSSVKAKLQDVNITADNYAGKDVTNNVLEVENIHYLDNNPETDVMHMVVFWSNTPINNVRMKSKLDQGADKFAKVLSVHTVNV